MSPVLPMKPLLYDPSLETFEKGEAETELALIGDFLKISEITLRDGGHAIRPVHAKSHGIVRGELIVADGLPPFLAQGLFARPGRYQVVLRFSTSPGDFLDDSVSTPRGVALKVFGVEGDRLSGSESATVQDFVLVNGKVFGAASVSAFEASLKLLAATTDRAEGAKKVLSAALRGIEKAVEAVGGESALLKSLGGQAETHILGDSFFSQGAIRYGDYVAKVGLKPASPELRALTDAPLNADGVPDVLRLAVRDFFRDRGGEWDFVVQLSAGGEDMPIENAHKPWPENVSPYLSVARLVVAPQESWSEAVQPKADDGLAFSPWNGLAAHRPLGAVMRVRKAVYAESQRRRLTANGCPFLQPARPDDVLPD
jgi:hypothetical protein